ncbi:YciI family protein [Nocardia sp. NPDC004582]
MTRFLVLYKSDQSARERMAQGTPEDMAAGMRAWMDWATRAGDALVDLGSPLGPGSVNADGGIGGFSILQAESGEAVQAVLKDHPHTESGGTIEVYEFLAMPGM